MEIDSYDTPDREALLAAAEGRLRRQRYERRELITKGMGGAALLLAASLLAGLAQWHRDLAPSSLGLVLLVWVVVELVRFPVAGGWTRPTMLAFVPALFLLPTPAVPLVAILAVLLRQAPEVFREKTKPAVVLGSVGDAWFTMGPALVLVLAGAERFTWGHWPLYAGALLAQVVLDLAWTICVTTAEGTRPRVVLPLLSWVYIVDASLVPLGLAIAAIAITRSYLVLLALSPMAMLWLFACERKQRMDDTVALSTAYRGTALLLGDIVEADDHYTGMHSRDVVDLSVAVAEELKLDGARRRDVEFAALLHDVGKIRIPKEIINKPGPLDPDEWELVKRHTLDGEQMLQMVGGALAEVGRIVRATHEHFNGRGYPDGLSTSQIPVEARIISACDAYSAMTTDRPYRKALTRQQALDELRSCAGRQFDPNVVSAIEYLIGQSQAAWLDALAGPDHDALPLAVASDPTPLPAPLENLASAPLPQAGIAALPAFGQTSKIQSNISASSQLVSI